MKSFCSIKRTTIAALILGAPLMGAGGARADQVIADDLIVQGSGCIGLDCADGYDFAFSTLVLRENNLRILFDDSSVSSGFPANKWQITINDSATGGANFFAVDDVTAGQTVFKLSAGAPANSIFLASSGNVGLGTAAPVLRLHLLKNDTPGMRLEQDNSGGFTAQTWDVAGNEANFFVRDVTGGSRLPFRIRPGAPTSSIDIAASGFVGVGTASPQANLHVVSAVNPTLRLQTTGSALGDWTLTVARANGLFALMDQISGNVPLKIFPGAPSSSIQVYPSGAVLLAGLPNCSAGIKTNANGLLSCITPPATHAGAVVTSRAGATKGLASTGGSSVASVNHGVSASGSASASSSSSPSSEAQEPSTGCGDGDIGGNWSMMGSNIEAVGPASVLWCDVQFSRADANAAKYSVSGNCRSHTADDAAPQNYVVSGVRSVAVTPVGLHADDLRVRMLRDLAQERLAVRRGHPVPRLDPGIFRHDLVEVGLALGVAPGRVLEALFMPCRRWLGGHSCRVCDAMVAPMISDK